MLNCKLFLGRDKRLVGEVKSEMNFCAFYNSKTYESIPELLIGLKVIDYYSQKAKYVEVDFLSAGEINNIISNTLGTQNFYERSINFNEFCKYLVDTFDFTFIFNEKLNDSILGKVNYLDKEIFIDKDLQENITSWRFTLAHEIGHLILHHKYSDQLSETKDGEIDVNELNDQSSNKSMEIQANIFASQLLMPMQPLLNLVATYFTEERIHKGYLFLDHQMVNQNLVMKFLSQLQMYFNVSKSVAKYRLIGLNLLKDNTDNSLRTIMRKNPNG